MQIYCDMDEVFSQFEVAALLAHGFSRTQCTDFLCKTVGHWSIAEAMRIPLNKFWEPIEATCNFWENLEPTQHCFELAKYLDSVSDDWCICTTPGSAWVESINGKLEWIEHHLGTHMLRRTIPIDNKEKLARVGTVLIDDNAENLRKFMAAGGHGIIAPARGNRLWSQPPLEVIRNNVDACLDLFKESL